MTNNEPPEINPADRLKPEFDGFEFKKNSYSETIENEQVRLLFSYYRIISISNSLFATLFVAFLWDNNNHKQLIGWLLFIYTIASIRWVSGVLYQKYNTRTENISFWKNTFMVVTAVNSLIWGVGSVLFFQTDNINQQYLIALFIFGLGSLGLSIYSSVSKMIYALLIPSFLPFIIILLLQGEYSSRILVLGLVLSFLFFVFASRRNYINTYENIYFRLKESAQKEALMSAKALIEKTSKAKSEFLSRMSHELRTPLNAILGFGQMLELDDDNMNKTQKENVSEILNAGQHLLNLINEVLDLSRIESGRLDIVLDDIPVSKSLNDAITLIKNQADARNIKIINNIAEQDYQVHADPIRLKQVLVNLLSNAVKYNQEQGKIIIDAQTTGKSRLKVKITDTGNGLTEKEIQLLFVPFDRLNVKNNIEGTGIGLVITQHLMNLMNGKLTVESEPGKGSVFSIELPLSA